MRIFDCMGGHFRGHLCGEWFQGAAVPFQSRRQWMNDPVSPHPVQHLVLPPLFIPAVLIDVAIYRRFRSASPSRLMMANDFSRATLPSVCLLLSEAATPVSRSFSNWVRVSLFLNLV